jgi:hypothetical protein
VRGKRHLLGRSFPRSPAIVAGLLPVFSGIATKIPNPVDSFDAMATEELPPVEARHAVASVLRA